MGEDEKSTLNLIHIAAKAEFLKKGFQSASLRNIVKNAGVTTGAFYGYYGSKEELFKALVQDVYEHIMSRYKESLDKFASLPIESQPEQMGKISRKSMEQQLFYCYEHLDELHLILQCSKGTRYAFMIDELVELEVDATHKYYDVLNKLGSPIPNNDRRLEHILVTGMMNAFFEMIIHDMPLDSAKVYLQELNDFYTAGWIKIMGQ